MTQGLVTTDDQSIEHTNFSQTTLCAVIESIATRDKRRILIRNAILPCPEGRIIGITGPTGCGKSTLLRALAGMRDWRGKGLVATMHWQDSGTSAPAPDSIAFLDQSPRRNLITRRVHDELAFSLAASSYPNSEENDRLYAAAKALGLQAVIHNATTDLSTGEAQRVALAEALCRAARLLLLDEPSAHLDSTTRAILSARLKQYVGERPGTSIVISSHDLAFLTDVCDGIFAIKDQTLYQTTSLAEVATTIRNRTPPSSNESKILCEARGLSIWRNGKPLIRDLSFVIRSGDCVVLRGDNGSGKTTLLEVLAGMRRGGVRIAGDVHCLGISTAKHSVPMPEECYLVVQDPDVHILGATIEEELRLYVGFSEERRRLSEEALCKLHLSPHDSTLKLSYGQKRLVAMLPLYIYEPRLILLDEPMAGLDGSMRNAIMAILFDMLDRGAAIVIATHDQDFKDQLRGTEISLHGDE